MQTIRIFLASSSELKTDRKKFEQFIGRCNKNFIRQNVFLELTIWEDFIDAMAQTRLQDKYNQAIKACDVFVMLYCTKVGKYTEEEFDTAFEHHRITQKPLIYTYFKDSKQSLSAISLDDFTSLWAFQHKLQTLGHFYTPYTSIDGLLLHFRQQLDMLKDAGVIPLHVPVEFPQMASPARTLPEYLNELALFIGRPHSAYDHVFDCFFSDSHPRANIKAVKVCFCLFTSEADQPDQFAEALGIRLETGAKKLLDHKLLDCRSTSDVQILENANPRDYASKKAFFRACLDNIAEINDLPKADSQTSLEAYCKDIYRRITISNSPIVFISENARKPISNLWWWPPAKAKALAEIKRCSELVWQFNQFWQHCVQFRPSFTNTAVVLIFCLKVHERIHPESFACFSLTPITDNQFSEWTTEMKHVLRKHLRDRNVSRQITAFQTKFKQSLRGKKPPNMRYQHFIEHTETITEQMANK